MIAIIIYNTYPKRYKNGDLIVVHPLKSSPGLWEDQSGFAWFKKELQVLDDIFNISVVI